MRFKSSKQLLVAFAVVVQVAVTVLPVSADGFERWPVITLDGEDYYRAGAPDGSNGATDLPGHYWVQAGPKKLVAKHYNSGPFGASSWWSTAAPDGELLCMAQVFIDQWTSEKPEWYASRHYVHYHESVKVDGGEPHATLVGWLKHTAWTNFTLDGGPATQFAH